MTYGIFNYLESGCYHWRSSLYEAISQAECQLKANAMMKVKDGLHLVVLELKGLKNGNRA